jgi:hypothetical protein
MDIVVSKGGAEIASGTLTVDTSTTPPTGTFTPDGGTEVTCNVSSWSSSPNGSTNWSFVVKDEANGDFPLGPNGNQFTYSFTGHENPQGTNPSGRVTWPPSLPGDENPTWQGDATEDEPISQGKAASSD